MAELRSRRDQVRGADLVELRVDTVRDPSAEAALEGRRLPVIFTCRPAWEGGAFTGSEDERRRLLEDACRLGADYVDIEWTAGFDDLVAARGGTGVVLSQHHFGPPPQDLAQRADAMRRGGAEVIKLAIRAERLSDCLLLNDVAAASTPSTVLIAMGDAGLATRVLPDRFRSSWTYAGELDAIGQVSASRLLTEFGFKSITDRTALYGVVGRPVAHSLSPAMHNAAFRASRIDAVYLPLAATDFADFMRFAEAMGLAGASVTAPFKLDACRYAAETDDVSGRIGSANTLRRDAGRWVARNTDVAAVVAPLVEMMPLHGTRVTILGAGGAARSAADALRDAGATVCIAARRPDRAQELAALTGTAATSWPPRAGSWDVLLNATPVGTFPNVDDTPLPRFEFDGELVYDLVYNPPQTRLLRDAAAAGCRTLGGLGMLVAQARRQFAWWTGVEPPENVMRDAALAALSGAPAHGTPDTLIAPTLRP
jgi:3-dehydroquinate dehydratase/shikimate dehydrogenase